MKHTRNLQENYFSKQGHRHSSVNNKLPPRNKFYYNLHDNDLDDIDFDSNSNKSKPKKPSVDEFFDTLDENFPSDDEQARFYDHINTPDSVVSLLNVDDH